MIFCLHRISKLDKKAILTLHYIVKEMQMTADIMLYTLYIFCIIFMLSCKLICDINKLYVTEVGLTHVAVMICLLIFLYIIMCAIV